MATFHFVSPGLVKRTNELSAKVKQERDRTTQEIMQKWVSSLEASKALESANGPDVAVAESEPDAGKSASGSG